MPHHAKPQTRLVWFLLKVEIGTCYRSPTPPANFSKLNIIFQKLDTHVFNRNDVLMENDSSSLEHIQF